MHLLWLTENYPPQGGGMAESCDRIVRGLRGTGARVDVVHLSRARSAPLVEEQEGGRYTAWPVGEDAGHDLHLLWQALDRDPDLTAATHLVAFGGALPIFAAPVLAAWLALPLITHLRGNDFDSAVLSPRRRPALMEALERSACVCVVSSEKVAKVERLVPGVRVQWTPNGIDLERFSILDSDARAGERWRAAEVENGRRVLALFGQLKRKKGVPFLLEALEHSGVAARTHLLVAGDPDVETRQALARSSAPHTELPFLQRYELLPYYSASDLVCIPSFYDGMPNVLLEAAALGVPVMGSSAGGMPDVIAEHESGYLFAAGDADECAQTLRRALAAPAGEPARLAARAREVVVDRFDAAAELRRHLEVLASTGRRSAPSPAP